jgi:hypothetical protein
MNEKKVFNFETTHDTANKTMSHSIKPFTVVVDWKAKTIRTMKGEVQIELLSFATDNFSLAQYEKLLLTVEKNANELNKFHND